MSIESDLISEDLQLSPATLSEKYTDDDYSVISTISEGETCHFFHENEHEYVSLSEAESGCVQTLDHHHHHYHQYCEQHSHQCHKYHHHQYCSIPRWSKVTLSDDDIEIIADPEYYTQFDDVFYIDKSVARSPLSEFLIQQPTPSNLHIHVDTRTKRQRIVARAVMIIAMVMFTVSVLLVVISLVMSDHIDNLVRNANTLLGKASTSPLTVSSTSVTLFLVNETMHNNTDFG